MCKKAVTISDYNKKYLLSKYGEKFASKIDVIHCGISLQTFQPVETEKTMLPVILAVGQLLERKGMRYLVDACRLLKRKGMEFRCHIVGDGKELKLLTEMIVEYELTEFVILLGRQPQECVKKLLQEASIFVLPSIVTEFGGREGIPVALMEAMAMQLPVVSTKTVGIPELIENGKEGLLVEQKNPEELASALEFLLKSSEVRIEMGRRGREKVTQQFNIDHVPALFQDIFN
jgi:glycosyltransferase involved in cell wall biosynthesis